MLWLRVPLIRAWWNIDTYLRDGENLWWSTMPPLATLKLFLKA